MRKVIRSCLPIAALLLPLPLAHAGWKAIETTQTYAISGKTGPDLYASIGARGPKIGGERRAIAHTGFKLLWSRKYQRQGDRCVLASAKPTLTITITLPEPAGPLPAAIQKNWQTFIAGVRAHEQVHAAMIRDLARTIETQTVGLAVSADPNCRKIKVELTRRLSAISAAHQQRNRDFDRAELSPGGTVHQLILNLVNGG